VTAYVALLRAVNLGSTNRLPMAELKRMCEQAGFEKVRTFIASGNVVFATSDTKAQVKAELEKRLKAFAGKPVDVFVRTAKEMVEIVSDFPFKKALRNRGVVIFLDGKPPADTLERISGQEGEKAAPGRNEIYVAYGEKGIGRSRLKIPAAAAGTARNINTVTKLAELAAAL
jgi:uncharacterized protein (DUF1697 family)